MCTALRDGGRRCSAHHPVAALVKSTLQSKHGMTPEQAHYVYRLAIAQSEGSNTISFHRYNRALAHFKSRMDLSSNDTLLENASEAEPPSEKVSDALSAISDLAEHHTETLNARMETLATRSGLSPEEVKQGFDERYALLATPRQTRVPSDAPVLDPKTEAVLESLRSSVEPVREPSRRIEHSRVGRSWTAGYDSEDGRAEMTWRDSRGNADSASMWVYRNVSEEDYAAALAGGARGLRSLIDKCETDPDRHRYQSAEDAEADAYRIWCERCSRFRLASGHACEDGSTGAQVVAASRSVSSIVDRLRQPPAEGGETEGETLLPRAEAPSWSNPNFVHPPLRLGLEATATVPGSARRGQTTNAQAIVPDFTNHEFVQALESGHAVTIPVGRRIPVRGSRGDFYDVTVDATFTQNGGNRSFARTRDLASIRCTCEEYQQNGNGRCQHLYPREGNALNVLLTRDLDAALRAQGGGWTLREMNTTISLEDEQSVLSPEECEGAIAAFEHGRRVNLRLGEEQPSVARTYHAGRINFCGPGDERLRPVLDQLTEYARTRGVVFPSDSDSSQPGVSLTDALDAAELDNDYRESTTSRFITTPVGGYLEHPGAFIRDYREAMDRAGQPLSVIEGSVTNGFLSNNGSGRGFGVELEFEGGNRYSIASGLYSAGISTHDSPLYYHANSENGYSSWTVESDSSCDGEVVSPILYDNEDSWANLSAVISIMKERGAAPGWDAGGHIHIGAQGMSANQRLSSFAASLAHEDTLRRLSSFSGENSSTAGHRSAHGNNYSPPVGSDAVYQYFDRNRHAPGGRNMFTFGNSRTIEFRDPNSSLDVGAIQRQVMLAAAVVRAGVESDSDYWTPDTLRRQRIGMSRVREDFVRQTITDADDRLVAENVALMFSLDSLFPDDEVARRRMLDLAVRTSWQAPLRSRSYGW